MKRILLVAIAVPLIVSGVLAGDIAQKLSLRFSPGGIIALGGSYTDTLKLSKAANPGAGLGFGLRYRMSENIYLDLGYDFFWLSVKKDQRPFAYKEMSPALNVQWISVNSIFFLSSGYKIEPYLTLGAGLCPWKFSQSPVWGASWPAPSRSDENFCDTSLGLSIGLGIDSYLFSRVTVFAEIKYLYLFSRDPVKFGTDDFTQQDFLSLGIGLTYCFGHR
jgi:opacity protein-like surface antigen